MSKKLNKTNDYRPLVDLLLILPAGILAVAMFTINAVSNETLNILDWRNRDFVSFCLFFLCACTFLIYPFVESKFNWDTSKFLNKFFDMMEYETQKKKFGEIILAHYTNVASVGLLLAVIVYCVRSYSDLKIIGLLSSLVIAFVFLVYGILLTKTAFGLRRYAFWVQLLTIVVLFFIDTQALELFLKSLPKLVPEAG